MHAEVGNPHQNSLLWRARIVAAPGVGPMRAQASSAGIILRSICSTLIPLHLLRVAKLESGLLQAC
jgi:hypothetical protein